MNQSFFYLTILLFVVCGCQTADKKTMLIKGEISSDYNGQIVYLVPRPHPTPETVDSVSIENGIFTFTVPADSTIYDITISRKAKANVQRLLIIAEKGILEVKIAISSSSCGTPLNDQLQHWKEQMEVSGQKAILLSQKISEIKDNRQLIEALKEEREKIYENFSDSTFNFIKRNQNPLGGYLFMTMGNMFNEQQRNELKKLGIDKWKTKT